MYRSQLYSKSVLILLLLSLPLVSFSQDKEQVSIVKADSTWRTEIIPFPIDWLPKLTFKGFEELRFAPNWSHKDHEEFWTLAMAWQVDAKTEVTLKEIQFNFNHYFDALMKPNHWATEFPEPQLELSGIDVSKSGTQFKGTMTFFDGFHTGKVITVNILGNQTLCKTTGKAIILFKLSTKDYAAAIWNTLNAIVINDVVCVD
jgi:hypothetical protein